MNHGRSIAFAFACLLASVCQAAEPSPLRITSGLPDHPSGIYYVKGDAQISLTVENRSDMPQEFSGEIVFGTPSGTAEQLKPVSVTPIQATVVPAGQRVKVPLALTFASAGEYALNWRQGARESRIPPATEWPGLNLQCIFAPRPAKPEESPWLGLLPPLAATIPGFLTDYMQQTTVRRFLIEERFSYDPATNVGLGFGASTGAGARQIDALLAEAAKAHAQFFLRLSIPLNTDTKTVTAFRTYLIDAIRRSQGTLAAVAITPEFPAPGIETPAQAAAYRTLYTAAYDAIKRADRNVLMLGAGSADGSMNLLIKPDPRLLNYIDALAITDATFEPLMATQITAIKKLPLFILPPTSGKAAPPAAALAQHAAVVPIPAPWVDNGVTAHLLNGTVFVRRLAISVPTADPNAPDTSPIPFIAVFQGDGYALGAIAGFSAGTELDAQFPGLAKTPTHIEPLKPDDKPYPNLQVGDDSRSMRVVDSAGAPIDCRIGDNLFVPAEEAVVYILQAGTADDLAGTLLASTANRLPLLEVSGVVKADNTVTLGLHNISTRPQSGAIRLVRPPAAENQPSVLLAERAMPAIATGQRLDLALNMPAELAPQAAGTLVVEITTDGARQVIQRTAITIP